MDVLARRIELQWSIYGEDIRPGHTPIGLKEELRARALAEYETSESEEELDPAQTIALWRKRRVVRPMKRLEKVAKQEQPLQNNTQCANLAIASYDDLSQCAKVERRRSPRKRKRSHDSICDECEDNVPVKLKRRR